MNGKVELEPDPIHVLLIAKHPPVRLNPTFDVDVADPEIVNPESVVVPNPVLDTFRNVVEAVLVTSNMLGVVEVAAQTVRVE